MANNLPDELIIEILSPVLDVSDDQFRSLSLVSPFSRLVHVPSSVLLCVCKAWSDVATPLLYQTVILRSIAQAYALKRTLQDNPALGLHIRKLRVEGGYGFAMQTIIDSAPHVVDLCLSLDMQLSDSARGLCRSLPSINPSCVVILNCLEVKLNKSLLDLVETLSKCFRFHWTNMVSLSNFNR